MSQILEDIRSAIASLDAKPEKANVGTIVELADGVAKVDGLSRTMMNEMLAFENGLEGIAFNLEQDIVGVVVMGDTSSLKEGMTCRTTGRLLSVPVGKELLGRVVDTLGNPVDGKGPIGAKERAPIEKIAPGIMPREPVQLLHIVDVLLCHRSLLQLRLKLLIDEVIRQHTDKTVNQHRHAEQNQDRVKQSFNNILYHKSPSFFI